MNTNQVVEKLAKQVALLQVEDLPALVQAQDYLNELAEQLDDSVYGALPEVASRASQALTAIILRETEDPLETINIAYEAIEYAQNVLSAIERGESVDAVPTPGEPGQSPEEQQPPIDEELLHAWIDTCNDGLNEIEACAVRLESAEDPQCEIDEIRRRIHTFKGECGVLSLSLAQSLCHRAETLIDECLEQANHAFPVDGVLTLVDWLKEYTLALESDAAAAPPPHQDVLLALGGAPSAPTPSPKPAQETTPNSSPTVSPEHADAASEHSSNDSDAPAAAISDSPEVSDSGNSKPTEPNAFESAPDDNEPVSFPAGLAEEENFSDFICEAKEHIAGAEEALLALETTPKDLELINTVFRAFHTIKGVAGFMHLDPIVKLAHNAEALLVEARNETLTLTTPCMNVILASCDMLHSMVQSLEGECVPPTNGALRRLIHSLEAVVRGEEPIALAPTHHAPKVPLGKILVDLGLATEAEVKAAIDSQSEASSQLRQLLQSELASSVQGDPVETTPADGGEESAQRLTSIIHHAKQSDQRLGERLNLTPKQLAPAMREQRRLSVSPKKTPAAVASQTQRKKHTDHTVKVNTERMDNLVDMVGELVIAQQMVIQDPLIQGIREQRTQRNLAHVVKIVRDLQEVSMSLRMVTLKGTFQKMARLVRDLSVKGGKSLNFVTEGEETELDRNVVEEIADPLVHMIRNACDHGVEPSDQRVSAGKNPTGTVTLRASHQSGSIVIEVVDDGRGLDRERILTKAFERGLIPAHRNRETIPDAEVFNLVFQPGFSTAEKITDISGRGVGMDVVRRNIEALRGSVEIQSSKGKGSTFVMKLPLTMAIIDGMVVRVGAQRYVLPTLSIDRSFQPKNSEIHTACGGRGEMAQVHGSLLPIHRLNRLFNLNEGENDPSKALLITLEAKDSRFCLMVDEIIGQQQVVIKKLGRGVGPIFGVSGGAILGDGKVAPIVDVSELVNTSPSQAA